MSRHISHDGQISMVGGRQCFVQSVPDFQCAIKYPLWLFILWRRVAVFHRHLCHSLNGLQASWICRSESIAVRLLGLLLRAGALSFSVVLILHILILGCPLSALCRAHAVQLRVGCSVAIVFCVLVFVGVDLVMCVCCPCDLCGAVSLWSLCL